jgi:hypothetical protein
MAMAEELLPTAYVPIAFPDELNSVTLLLRQLVTQTLPEGAIAMA